MAITFPRDLPTGIKFESSRFGLNVNQSAFSSEISRKVQIQQLNAGKTDRWEGVYTTPRLSEAQHRELTAWLISLRGREGTFLAGDPDLKSPRSGTAANLLPADSLDEFSGAGPSYRNLMANTALHLLNLKAGDVVSAQANLKSTAGLDRLEIRLIAMDHDGAVVTETGSNFVQSSTYALAKVENYAIPSGAATLRLSAKNLDVTETAFVRDGTVRRGATSGAEIARVNGASQTGRALNVDSMTASQNRLFLIGDYFTVQGVDGLYRLTENVITDGSGATTLAFEPALRASPADGAQLLFENTRTKCRLVTNVAAWETDNLKTGPISFAWEEAI